MAKAMAHPDHRLISSEDVQGTLVYGPGDEEVGETSFALLLERKSRRVWKWTSQPYNGWSWEESIVRTADSNTKWLVLSIGSLRCICLTLSRSSL
jgi:hypothetical protein